MNQSNTKKFIDKCKKVHGDRYNYDKVVYTKSIDKVIITCCFHGDFLQTPAAHLSNRGCPKCKSESISKKLSHSTCMFIEKAINKYGNKYDYSIVDYKNNSTKVNIICPIHGLFEQTPNGHLSGRGCFRCGGLKISNSKTKTTEQFIKDANIKHLYKYDYSKVNYVGNKIDVIIGCDIHGYFNQCPNSHLSGRGCPECGIDLSSKKSQENPTGWTVTSWEKAANRSKWFDSFKVYVIKCYNDNETFFKVGRTFLSTRERFKNSHSMPYKFEILKEFIFDNARDAFNKELELKIINKGNNYVPSINFKGMYECFNKIKI